MVKINIKINSSDFFDYKNIMIIIILVLLNKIMFNNYTFYK